jgi:hypothetical protein
MFTLMFEALKAPYFCRETVFQYPGHRRTVNEPAFVPEEFVVEENVNFLQGHQQMRESTQMTRQ